MRYKQLKWFPIITIFFAGLALQAVSCDIAEAGNVIGSRLTADEVDKIVTLHNRFRGEVGVGPLVWSANLAVYAQTWADHLASASCRMEHRPYSGPWKQLYGENLFLGTIGYHGVADAIRTWAQEKSSYRGEILNSSNWHVAGHYTQMVWRNTRRIGCAKAECRGMVIIVCNYDPPGNELGERPY